MKTLYLASTSPRRIAFLHELGLPFTVLPPSGEEPVPSSGEQAAVYALRAARAKARSVLEHIPSPIETLLPAPGQSPALSNPPDSPKSFKAANSTSVTGTLKGSGSDSSSSASEHFKSSRLTRGSEDSRLQKAAGGIASVIIAADTVVVLEGRIYGKPGDSVEALGMLRELAGRTHSVITGCALLQLPARFAAQPSDLTSRPASSLKEAARSALPTSPLAPALPGSPTSPASIVVPEAMEAAAFAVKSRVTLWQAPDELLRSYAESGESLDKAGAYAVQGAGACLVQAVEGSWTNVVGLPLAELMLHLLRLGAVRPAVAGR